MMLASSDQPIHSALEGVLKRAMRQARDLHLEDARLIVLCDVHRGARNRADDFAEAEKAYLAALAYYYERGYTLVLLGDVDELWQEPPERVLDCYEDCVALEAKFHQAGRYLRLWGNHDDLWESPEAVHKHLQPRFGGKRLDLPESLLFIVHQHNKPIGRLLLVHGHQGSAKSDRWMPVAKLAIRYLYRPFQLATGLSLDTPSKNPRLREVHNKTAHAWAAAHDGLVLIAGHTHRPVFESRSDAAQTRRQLESVQAKLAERPDDKSLKAKAEWLEEALQGEYDYNDKDVKPCYFNAGCCCYPGGDITGIEIEGGEIRLVHWPDEAGAMQPQVLERDDLGAVFGRC